MKIFNSRFFNRVLLFQLLVYFAVTGVFAVAALFLDFSAAVTIAGLLVLGGLAVAAVALYFGNESFKKSGQAEEFLKWLCPEEVEDSWQDGDEWDGLSVRIKHAAKKAREDLKYFQSEKEKITAILNYMTEAVLAVDRNLNVIEINAAAEKLMRIARSKSLGKSLIEVTRDHRIDKLMNAALPGVRYGEEEMPFGHAREKVFKVQAVGADRKNLFLGGVLVITDVTEIRRLEKLRSEFVANVSHELRTPLATIQGFLETLLAGACEDVEQSRIFLKMMEKDANRLRRLIDDLLELAKLESGESKLRWEQFDIREEVKDALDSFEAKIRERKIEVIDHLAESSPLIVRADRGKIQQVLINLIENAVKFSKQNGVITVSSKRSGGDLIISVKDTGCGISEEAVGRIFERFYRADKARSRDSGGTGLGLSIVKHIVEAHGGKVTCVSKSGEGSLFSFSVPAAGEPELFSSGNLSVAKSEGLTA